MTTANQDLVVLTVAYHSQQALKALAEDFGRQTKEPNLWIVVNNSPQSAEPLLIGDKGYIKILEGNEGDGFGIGCNRGLDYLLDHQWEGWVWLLNPDAVLLETSTIEDIGKILGSFRPRALIGTGVLDGFGDIDPSAGWIDPGFNFRSRNVDSTTIEFGSKDPVNVDWLSGCSLLFKPNAHESKPRFENYLPLYYEDIDFCLRLSKDGSPVLWLPSIWIGHQRGHGSQVSSGRRLRLSTCSYVRFLQRYRSGWVLFFRTMRLLSKAFVLLPLQPRKSWAVLQGWWEAFRQPLA